MSVMVNVIEILNIYNDSNANTFDGYLWDEDNLGDLGRATTIHIPLVDENIVFFLY